MSGTVRAGLVFGLAALVAFFGSIFLPIPCVNFIIGIVSVIALGWGAGKTAAKTTNAAPGQGTGRGATAGAIGGTVLLIGTAIAFFALSNFILSLPTFRDQIAQALSQNPDVSQLTPEDLRTALGATFAVVGFGCGIMNFVLMLLGGLIGGATWKGTPAAAYVPAGGSAYTPESGSYIPQQSNQPYATQQFPNDQYGNQQSGNQTYGSPPTYGNQANPEGGARVYDPNDPNRPPQ